MKNEHSYRRLFWMLRLMRFLRIGGWQAVVIQAVIMGLAGAAAALAYDAAAIGITHLLTGLEGTRVDCFAHTPPLQRALLPALGAVPAALVLGWALKRARYPMPEYMEAFSLGNGRLPRTQGMLRSLSAACSLGSGAAIGKEGALMQISAVAASAAGRWLHVSPPRLRLMVGCGAAAGMTAAFHTPLSACLFVCEIVIGTFSIGALAPLLVAACSAYVLISLLGDSGALFENAAKIQGLEQTGLCLALALLAALAARAWVRFLGFCRRALNGRVSWLMPRMVAAGALVGLAAVYEPAVVGNGQEPIVSLVAGDMPLGRMALLLGLKVLLVAVVFGVGTMGGALTPTLMIGCFLGGLFGGMAQAWGASGDVAGYAIVGMAAFFAVAGRAPVTALLLGIEFTMNAGLAFPLMAGVAAAYAFSRLLPGRSLYDAASATGPANAFDAPMAQMRINDIYRPASMQVHESAPMDRVLRVMLRHPGENVPVAHADGSFAGLVLNGAKLPAQGNAASAMRRDIPELTPGMGLPEALGLFARTRLDSLPVVAKNRRLLGMVSRAELYQTTALMMRKELARAR